jgi:spermidine synthase
MRPRSTPAERSSVLLFAATSFASAFLIFLVEPVVAKRILPWFGGAPAVWSVCIAFYQVTLFAGYGYAHLLTRWSVQRQLAVHALVVGAAMIALPVVPGDTWKPDGTSDPSAAILATLLANVALPFAALAATGPLVAVWFARRHPARSPYPLYAVSNLGSLVALIAYPFALEPRLSLSVTGALVSAAFMATGAAVIACAALAWRSEPAAAAPGAGAAAGDHAHVPAGQAALWIALAACGAVILVGVSNELCLDIASVPFLWILPLSIYLVTLVLCFGTARIYRRTPFVLLALLALAAPTLTDRLGVAPALEAIGGQLAFQLALYGNLLFATCMVLHGELYRLRPHQPALPLYYVCVAGGGALGGLAVGVGAPLVFDEFYELPLGLALALILLLLACRDDPRGLLGRAAPRWRVGVALALAGVGMALAGADMLDRPASVLYQARSFFGVLSVEEYESDRGPVRVLMHGSTIHGSQLENEPDWPTSYYSIYSGIGIALSRRDPGVPAEIGVVGLGTGTLAAYGRAGDHLVFFESDPRVVELARDGRYFTYLARTPARVSIVEGDGRISLTREIERKAPRFDFLIIDAFSSDMVPVHLLTREALAVYLDALEPDGLLAIHVSSRYFDLMPVVSRLAADSGLHAVNLVSVELEKLASGASSWVLLARDEQRIRSLANAGEHRTRWLGVRGALAPVQLPSAEMLARAPLWTDDYSDLLGALVPRDSAPDPDHAAIALAKSPTDEPR